MSVYGVQRSRQQTQTLSIRTSRGANQASTCPRTQTTSGHPGRKRNLSFPRILRERVLARNLSASIVPYCDLEKYAGSSVQEAMTKSQSAKPKESARVRDFITISRDTFAVGDNILVKGDGADLPFVGRIRGFKNKQKDLRGTLVKVSWFYRPEECRDGRKQFHGEKELFKSDHIDWIEPQTISGKCNVHSLSQYRELEDEGDDDYFTRFTYTPSQDKFGPDSVPVYCTCELPYNPDTYMIMCERCEEWYHPRCIGLAPKEVELYDSTPFTCPACNKKRKA